MLRQTYDRGSSRWHKHSACAKRLLNVSVSVQQMWIMFGYLNHNCWVVLWKHIKIEEDCKKAVRSKCHDLLTSDAICCCMAMRHHTWQGLGHQFHNLDIAPCDFHLFRTLGKHYGSNSEVTQAVQNFSVCSTVILCKRDFWSLWRGVTNVNGLRIRNSYSPVVPTMYWKTLCL